MAQNAVERKAPGNQEGLRLAQVGLQKELGGGEKGVLSNVCMTHPGHWCPESRMKVWGLRFGGACPGDRAMNCGVGYAVWESEGNRVQLNQRLLSISSPCSGYRHE